MEEIDRIKAENRRLRDAVRELEESTSDAQSRANEMARELHFARKALERLRNAALKSAVIAGDKEFMEAMFDAREALDRAAKPEESRSPSLPDPFTFLCSACKWTGNDPKTIKFRDGHALNVCPQCYKLRLGNFSVRRLPIAELGPKQA